MSLIYFIILLTILCNAVEGKPWRMQEFCGPGLDGHTGANTQGKQANMDDDVEKCGVVLNPKKIDNLSIAVQAAKDAKSAVDLQQTAGIEAARQTKLLYAERAMSAAKAAETVLRHKQQVIEELTEEMKEAEEIIAEETNAADITSQNVQAALMATQQAQQTLDYLKRTLEVAMDNVENSEKSLQGLQANYEENLQLVEAAKKRSEMLMGQIAEARAVYAKTRKAAYNAACAAKQATENVDRP